MFSLVAAPAESSANQQLSGFHGEISPVKSASVEIFKVLSPLGCRVASMLNKQIAGEIGASEPTAKIHRGNVMRKMEAGSVVDLVRMADKLKLSPRK